MEFIPHGQYTWGKTTDNNELINRLNRLCGWLYNREPSGGYLHIVLDDDNLEDCHIAWCIARVYEDDNLPEYMKTVYYRIAGTLFSMSLKERAEWIGLSLKEYKEMCI